MKQKLLDSLKTKFSGVNEVVLDRIAVKLAKTVTNEADVDTAVAGVTFQQIIDGEADRRATEASLTAVSNYEKKYSLKEGKAIEAPQPIKPPVDDGGEAPAWAKSLLEQNKRVEDRLNAIESEKVAIARKGKIAEVIKGLPEGLKKPYGRVDVVGFNDELFDAYLKEVETEVCDILKEMSSKGATFGTPPNGGTPTKVQPTDKELESVVNSIV